MPFDPSTATLVEEQRNTGFDPSTARLVDEPASTTVPSEEMDADTAAVLHSQAVAKEMQTPEATARAIKPFIPLPEWQDTGQGNVLKRTAQQVYTPVKELAETIESRAGIGLLGAVLAAPEVVGPALAITAIPQAVREEMEAQKSALRLDVPRAVGHQTRAVLAASMLLGLKPLQKYLPQATREAAIDAGTPAPSQEPAKVPESVSKPPSQTAVAKPPRPEVPETPPESMRGVTVLEEIRAAGADTKAKVQALFPHLTREEAGRLRDQAFPRVKVPDNLSQADVERLFLGPERARTEAELAPPAEPEPAPAPKEVTPAAIESQAKPDTAAAPEPLPGTVASGTTPAPPAQVESGGAVPPFPNPVQLPRKGVPKAEREAEFNRYLADVDRHESELKAWEAAWPQNKPILFSKPNGGYELITPDPQGGWRATAFSIFSKEDPRLMPWGHERYKTRYDAVKEYAQSGKLASKLPEVMTEEEIRSKTKPQTPETSEAPEKPKPAKRGAVQRPWDIIDEIQASVGKIRGKKHARPGSEGYYSEAYNEAKEGAGRNLFGETGQSPDEALDVLRRSGMISKDAVVEDMWDAIKRAKNQRRAIFQGQTPEIQADKFQTALQKQGSKKGSHFVSVGDLSVGDKFRIAGEELEVVSINPDTGEVTVKDGRKFGHQTIPDGADIPVEKGSLEQKAKSPEFTEEDFSLNAPESVEEQKARLAHEEALAKEKADREKVEEKAAMPLVGSRGDIGQQDMFGGGDLFSQQQGPGISKGPGAARAGEPGTYTPISQLSDRLSTTPVKGLKEAIGVGEKFSDMWAEGKDAMTRALGKLRVVPSALKRAYVGLRDFNDVERRVQDLDWPLQQSAAKSKAAGQQIKRSIPASQIRDGMAIWIDAGGDETSIRNALDILPRRTKPRVRRALEAALALPDSVKEHATSLSDFYAQRAQEAQSEGVLEHVLEDYFTHIWKKPANMPDSVRAALNSGRVNEYFQYARRRRIPTFLEGILQGREPVLDPAEVIPHYNYLMDRAIASRRFIKSLEDATMPDGSPVLGPWGTRATVGDPGNQAVVIKIRGRPEDYNTYRQIDHPALRKWKWAATDEQGRPVFYEGTLAVHPDAYPRLARMMDRSRLSASPLMRGLLRVSGEVKAAKLGLLSPFHQVHVGSHALGHWTNPFTNVHPIDWDAPTTQFAVQKGGLKLAPNPAEMANFAEGILSPGLIHKFPVLGPLSKAYSEWLFTDYLPRLKLKTFENAWARNRKWYSKDLASGRITEEQLASRVGDSINNAYGELNQLWLGKHGRDPRVQRGLRLGFLAPDFGEARLRFVGKAGTRFGLEERLALGTLFTTLYVGARVGNILTHGDPEIEDWKHAFAVKAGNRWYSMRSVIGDTLHAFANFPNFLYVRLNPAYARGVMEFFTGRDITGRKRTAGQQVLDELKQIVPIHLSGLTRDDQHVWESFIQSIGVGSQRSAPTAEVSQLAADWKKKRGISDKTEILSDRDSPYRKARLALEFGHREDFQSAVTELINQRRARGDRTPRESVRKAFERYYTQPFSGSARMEPAFKASLGPTEGKKYMDALIERRKLLQQFRQWY